MGSACTRPPSANKEETENRNNLIIANHHQSPNNQTLNMKGESPKIKNVKKHNKHNHSIENKFTGTDENIRTLETPKVQNETKIINNNNIYISNQYIIQNEGQASIPHSQAKRRDTKLSTKTHINSKHNTIAFKDNPEEKALKFIKKHNRDCEDQHLIEQCLLQHFFMRSLDRLARIEIVKEMSLAYIEKDNIIFKQGNVGIFFYIIKSGSVELIINDKVVKTINGGECFGELALLHESTRSGTIKATSNCNLWVLGRKNFRKIVEHITKKNYEENKQFIQSIPILNSIESSQKSIMISSLYKVSFEKGEYIVKEGEQADCLYIIKTGEVSCCLKGRSFRKLKKGDFFGEKGILIDSNRTLDVISLTKSECFAISIATFRNMFGDNFRYLLYLNFIKSSFALSKCFREFNTHLLEGAVFNLFKPRNLKRGEIAFNAGYETSSKIVIIIDGNLVKDQFGNCIQAISQKEIDEIDKNEEQEKNNDGEKKGDTHRMSNNDKLKIINHKMKMKTRTLAPYSKTNNQLNNLHIVSDDSDSQSSDEEKDKKSKDVISEPDDFERSAPDIKITSTKLISRHFCLSVSIEDIICKRGEILFEEDLYNNVKNKTNYCLKAFPDCLLVEADTEKVLEILGKSFIDIVTTSNIYHTLTKVNLFRELNNKKLIDISKKIKTATFKDGEKIITKGEEGNKFFIVKKGNVDIYLDENTYIRTITQNDFLGERALLLKEPRSCSAIAKGDVECLYLEKTDFLSSIEENMKMHLINRLYLQDSSIELEDLEFVQKLGEGNFGNVYLVRSKKSKFKYALKSISKRQVVADSLILNLELEKNILLQLEHPFIVKLVKTLKDKMNVYFLMEYIKGKELFDVIRDIGLLNKKQTLFYSCSMMLACQYLKERHFIYRDIKPENIMVCENGYVKMIDFGTSKNIVDRTNTVIGTPHYMAPEIILGEGYSFEVDFWSIAVCMYEFMCGYVPFGESAEDPMQVYLSIINGDLIFPDYVTDCTFKDLMTQMLNKKPEKRLSEFSQIKAHPWFEGYDWDELINLNVKPDYIPKLKNKPHPKEKIMFIDYIKSHCADWINDKSHDETDNENQNYDKSELEEFFEKF